MRESLAVEGLTAHPGGTSVGLQHYLDVLRKRWITVAAGALLGALAGLALALLATPVYTASTQLYVSVQGGQSTSDLVQGSNFTRQQVTSYTAMVGSPLVLGPVIDELGLDERAESLAGRVRAQSPVNSSLINITVNDENGALAATTANAVAEEFARVIDELETPAGGGTSPVKTSVVREAVAPTGPSSPRTSLNVALGLVIGLAAGIAVAALREALDTRVRTEADVLGLTDTAVIGTITHDDEVTTNPLMVQGNPRSQRAESFRRLRTNVQFLEVDGRPQSIVVTSSLPGEGKTSTTLNLAIALAQAGTRVALVDADLRRPAVARYMGLEGAVGLTTVLIGRAEVQDVIQPWGDGHLHVLPSGQIPPNPSELLGSQRMAQLLRSLTEQYDVVLVDTPPLLPVTDAAILSRLCAGAIVVVGADRLHRHQLTEALGALEQVDARVLGIVLNRIARKQTESYTYYEYTPAGSDGPPRRKRRSGSATPPARARAKAPRRVSSSPVPRADTASPQPSTETAGEGASRWPGGPLGVLADDDRRP